MSAITSTKHIVQFVGFTRPTNFFTVAKNLVHNVISSTVHFKYRRLINYKHQVKLETEYDYSFCILDAWVGFLLGTTIPFSLGCKYCQNSWVWVLETKEIVFFQDMEVYNSATIQMYCLIISHSYK